MFCCHITDRSVLSTVGVEPAGGCLVLSASFKRSKTGLEASTAALLGRRASDPSRRSFSLKHPDNWRVRFFAWNIWGGSRQKSIREVVRAANPDVAVLSDCRPANYIRLVADLREDGYAWATGTNQGDFTGMLIASKFPIYPGSTASTVLPGHWCHIVIPSARLSVVGVYGPLRRRGVADPVQAFWNDLLDSTRRLSTQPTIVVGDLNTVMAPQDTTSGLLMPGSKELQRLAGDGWSDVFREIHHDRPEYSYWETRGAFRIDYAMRSPAAPPARSAEYIRKLAGYSLGRWSEDPKSTLASDHAAILFDIA
jgi:exonuclease III